MRSKSRKTKAHVEFLEHRRLLTATIVGRYVFYGDSVYDTGSSISPAIAPDKTALLPGHSSTFANYTSYSKGINGIAIDAVNWPAAPVAGDFVLRAGNTASPAAWSTVSQPVIYSIQRGAGTGGSDRIVLRLPDGAIRNEWLQITVNANADTGLGAPDVFYFGNAPGDDGHNLSSAVVDASDVAGARADSHGFANPAPVTDLYDFNRDGRVDATDQLIARNNIDTSATALQMLTAPAASDPATSGPFTGVFNVKLYGAKGDGATDDTAAIQTAINAMTAAPAGGLLYFPSGTYRISSFLEIQGLTNFEIRGTSATLMPLDSDTTTTDAGDVLRIGNCSNFTLSGLTFNGDSAARIQIAQPASLRIAACSDFRVAACNFNNTVGDGLYVYAANPADSSTASHDGLIEGCAFNSAYRNAISLIHGYRIAIQSNLIQNVAGALPQCGIDIEANPADSDVANHDDVIVGNSFLDCAGAGVYINEPQHPTAIGVYSNSFADCPNGVTNEGVNSSIDNNTFHDYTAGTSAVAQIYFGTATGQSAQVTGNDFYSITGKPAIGVASTWTGQVLVASNRISGFSGYASALIGVASDGATITGNNIQTSGTGISVAANGADIENNVLTGGSGEGIYTMGFGQTIRNNSINGFVTGIESTEPTSGGTALTTIDGNVIWGCPTGVKDSAALSEIDSNSFIDATLPSSGPGATAYAQVYLSGNTGGLAQISANSFSSLTGLAAIYIHPSWVGKATISNNQISNLGGASLVGAILIASDNAVITGNVLQNVATGGISVGANNADIENNTIPAGAADGIYLQGNNGVIRHNSVSGHPVGVEVTDPSTGVNASTTTTVDNNTITNCPTAVRDTTTGSSVTNNLIGNASLPTSGPGSDAVGQIYLLDIAAGRALISGNTINSITGLCAIYVHTSWSGLATISANQIDNVTSADGIVVGTSNTVITTNTLQNIAGTGISISASSDGIENNNLTTGSNFGIYAEGGNHTIKNNTLVDFGFAATGQCIFTLYGSGGDVITGNTVSKSVPNSAWVPIVINPLDLPGINYRYGMQGPDGAFTPNATTASLPAATGTSQPSPAGAASTMVANTTNVRRHPSRRHLHRPLTN